MAFKIEIFSVTIKTVSFSPSEGSKEKQKGVREFEEVESIFDGSSLEKTFLILH